MEGGRRGGLGGYGEGRRAEEDEPSLADKRDSKKGHPRGKFHKMKNGPIKARQTSVNMMRYF